MSNLNNIITNIKKISCKLDINGIINTLSLNTEYVLLGECTHGTQEFYQIRSSITKILIEKYNFKVVLLEGNWSSLYRVNQYVTNKNSDKSAEQALESINSYPLWMWRNDIIAELIEWIREYNSQHQNNPVRILGMDCYKLLESKKMILKFLKQVDTQFYDTVKKKLSFLDNFKDEKEYGYAVIHGSLKTNSKKIQDMFQKLLSIFQWEKFDEYLKICQQKKIDVFELISIDQCFELMVNADEYYRKMYSEPRGSQASWNIRDQHMTMTVIKLNELLQKVYQYSPKMIIWAHNSHVGDSNATNRGGLSFEENNTWNLGQMVRNTFGKEKVKIFGFYTNDGSVRASTEWDTPSKKYELNQAVPYSYEWFFHQVSEKYQMPNFYLDLSQLENKNKDNSFLIYRIPCKYKILNSLNKITETSDPNSKVLKSDLKPDTEFIATERKVLKNKIVRLKIEGVGWITEYIGYGNVTRYCLPVDYQYPEDISDFFNTYWLQRWIGVNYNPKTEMESHYGETRMGSQYDCVVYLDKTNELKPLTKKRNELKKLMGVKRLTQEYRSILKDPIENIETHPLEENIFEWHYVIKGTQEPYCDGFYHGKVIFPDEYPLKPPKILMITPNGRFEIEKELCLSISNYHPESWNPAWTIETILIGLYSFMLEDELTTGSIKTSPMKKKQYAKQSLEFNLNNQIFKNLFTKFIDNNREQISSNNDTSNQLQCRYCFNYDILENLISPCQCKGNLKWVHLTCLRKWQKSVLLTQSTNPKYRTNIDETCNVCLTKFNVKPPDRYEMMLKYAGNEMAKLLIPSTFMVSDKTVSENNIDAIKKHKEDQFFTHSVNHWTYGVYLITDVIKNNNSDDTILGVDFTRPITQLPTQFYTLDKKILNIQSIWKKYDFIKNIPFINIKYFIGGPCNPEAGVALVYLPEINKSKIDLSEFRIIKLEDKSCVYGPIEYVVQLIVYFYKNVSIFEKIDMYAFVGVAGWSREQLLGEISRRHWGLCNSKLDDLINYQNNMWENIYNSGRIIVAASSEFSQTDE